MSKLNILSECLRPSDKMPIMFIGHGNPMNTINGSKWSKEWEIIGKALPRPHAILCISAHWMTSGETLVNIQKTPRTIHDFGGFPKELFDVQYPAPGAPELAKDVVHMITNKNIRGSEDWGLDHGAWSVLKLLYPHADIPVFQISIDLQRQFSEQMEIGYQIKNLRERGVLVLGSGNLVHNLPNVRSDGHIYDWAFEFDEFIANTLKERDFSQLINIDRQATLFRKAHPTAEHFMPMLYCLGLVDPSDGLTFFNEDMDLGSISMRSFIFHAGK